MGLKIEDLRFFDWDLARQGNPPNEWRASGGQAGTRNPVLNSAFAGVI